MKFLAQVTAGKLLSNKGNVVAFVAVRVVASRWFFVRTPRRCLVSRRYVERDRGWEHAWYLHASRCDRRRRRPKANQKSRQQSCPIATTPGAGEATKDKKCSTFTTRADVAFGIFNAEPPFTVA